MSKTFISLILISFLAACQTGGPTYAQTLQPWVGQSEERLQQSWGIPHDVFYVTPNEKVVTFLQISSHARGGNTEPYANEFYYPAVASPNFGFPDEPQYTNYYCKTSFTIINGVVSNYSFNGDDCTVES